MRLLPPPICPPCGSLSPVVGRPGRGSASANALHLSDWFIEVRKVVEIVGWRRFILSRWLRRVVCSWASEVRNAIQMYLFGIRSVVFFAGRRYREHL